MFLQSGLTDSIAESDAILREQCHATILMLSIIEFF